MLIRKGFLWRSLCLFVAMLGLLSACSFEGEKNTPATMEVLSQKPTPEGKIPVTVLVKYAFSINAFEKAIEEKFPKLDLIQVGNYSSDRGLTEYARRLEHGDLTDIVMTWPLNVGEEFWPDRLLDLSAMPFTSRYHVSMLDSISRDGKLYYLPGPAQVRGIVYNKTLFAEKGWQVPRSFDEFVLLCQTIEKSGLRSIQLGFRNSEVLDTAFAGYSFGDSFSKPKDVQWLADYNNGIGTAANQLKPAFDTFQRMIDAGIWKPSDLEIDYSQRETMLFNRQCAMVEDSVLMTRMGTTATGTDDEFALMPFFNAGDNSDWARLYMVCYIGLNKQLAEDQNEEKMALVMEMMDYISTEEGQNALAADTGAMYSSLTGVAPPNITEIKALLPALAAGRYAIFPELTRTQQTLRTGLSDMLLGKATATEVLAALDIKNSAAQEASADETTLATATDSFTLPETGAYITDEMRTYGGTDIALFMDNGKDGRFNGKGICGKIYKGKQTNSDVLRILPDFKSGDKGLLQTTTMTGADLISTLEYSIPVENNNTGWFYYFSGLKITYDISAEPGARIQAITTSDGTAIDPQKDYTLTIMAGTVDASYMKNTHDTGLSITKLIHDAMEAQGEISPSGDGRFTLA